MNGAGEELRAALLERRMAPGSGGVGGSVLKPHQLHVLPPSVALDSQERRRESGASTSCGMTAL